MGETELADGTTIAHPSQTMASARGMIVEGRGVEPSRVVPMAPHDAIRGRDAQLEAAATLAAELAGAERARRTAHEDASHSGRRADIYTCTTYTHTHTCTYTHTHAHSGRRADG